ncbi:ribosomal protein S18-alanine N-acetyltransferase [Tissierella sp. Yu-01]|uniref:ribosomal protein S18-alanine N-acetyltransferase n=1 Tax=Tissierella sp. Yu-01 TaxID=3035694 RepID=UPI00240DC4C7|nr:ribosomal protein S18-alanine N-acetyltransferase [Tissierella sp. Yu-01]WFA08717.1 ribosomal protein S18-alanine N-acetyltransferase [Tissierella sp. Yu-01]
MKVILREMELEDLDQIMEIENEAFTTPWSRNAFTMEITDNLLAKYIIAEVDGKVAGYAGIWLIIDEGHITNIAVKKEYQGQGIGKYLIMGLIDYCKKQSIINMTLEVRKSNTIAQNLYKKYGFIDCGIRPNYYADDHEDAVIMWKTIED